MRHASFGEGIVIKITRDIVSIRFSSGIKKLSVEFAKLAKLD